VPPERVDPARLSQQLTSALPLHDPLADSAAVRVLRDRTYRSVDGHGYPLDVYQPTSAAPPRGRPAVVLVHGQAHPALLRDAKGWPALQGLARVLAARDLVAVVPNLGSTASGPSPEQCFSSIGRVADNVVAAVRHVQAHAVSLGVDRRRIALWVAGEGGLYGLGPALGRELNGSLVCAVALCPTLDETLFAHTRPPLSAGLIERLRPTAHLRRHGPRSLPILVVRAEHDRTEVNRALDAFVALAEQVQAPVTLLRHEHGHRGFEVVDATDETRDVLDRAFQLLETYL
jgi:alpha-beta hydrolase superfamily lysophospholipase